jgi:hypothetical protein
VDAEGEEEGGLEVFEANEFPKGEDLGED